MRDSWVFDAFVIERLHLRVRSIAENVKRLDEFETSVLSGVVNSHSRRAQESSASCGLIGRSATLPGEPNVFLSEHMELSGKIISVGDS